MPYRYHKDPGLIETGGIGRKLIGRSVTPQLLRQVRDDERLFLLVRIRPGHRLEAILLPRSPGEIEAVRAEFAAVPGTTVVGFSALSRRESRRVSVKHAAAARTG